MNQLSRIFSLIGLTKKYKLMFIVFATFLNSLLETLGIALIYPIINFLLVEDFLIKLTDISVFKFLSGYSEDTIFKWLLIILVCITFLKVVSQIILVRTITSFVSFTEAKLSINLLKQYLQFPYLNIIKKNSSNIINELTNITSRFTSQIISPILILFSDFIILIMVSILLFFVNALTYTLTLIFLFLFFLFYTQIIKKLIIAWGRELNEFGSQKIKIIQQIFKSIKNFKLSSKQSVFFISYSNYSNKIAKNALNYKTILEIPRLTLELLVIIIFSLSLFFLKDYGLSNIEIISFVGIYAACFFRLIPIINRVIFNYQELKFGKDSLNQLLNIKKDFELEKQITIFTDSDLQKEVSINEIIFNKVDFEYSPGANTLKNVNFKINNGERVGIIGKTGSGKTTLIDLLCGLIKPQNGEVLVNGKKIFDNLNVFRNSIGYVPQTVFLNDDTLTNNIAFGVERKNINFNKINEIIKILNLDRFVNNLPNKLETNVGENGFNLSGGQRQRVGIARSLYHQPNLLIFDEATNSLDIETEKFIYNELKYYLKNTIFVMITHKEESLNFCTRVLKVKNAEVFDIKN